MFGLKELLENRVTYHSDCYKSVTNKEMKKKFHCNNKKYIKSVILQKESDVQLSRTKSRRDAEIIYLEAKRDQSIDQHMNEPDTYNETFAAASLIRCDILGKNRWKFTRSYNDDKIPNSLEQLLKQTIIGLKETVDVNAKKKKCR